MENKIAKTMPLGEIVAKYPGTAEILMGYGLHCIGCHGATWETLEQGALAHGMSEETIESMLKRLNEFVENNGPKPQEGPQ